jgi:chitinase
MNKRLILYYTNWSIYDRNFNITDLPFGKKYTLDINYCFLKLDLDSNGYYIPVFTDRWADLEKPISVDGIQHLGNLGVFRYLLSKYSFNLGISIGGYTFSTYFSKAVMNPEARHACVDGLLLILLEYPFITRIDLYNSHVLKDFRDWEHISNNGQNYGHPQNVVGPNDAQNFGLFLELLRNTLDINQLSHVEISACASANHFAIDALPLDIMSKYLNTINVMTYDFASSSWGPCLSTHHSNLYSVSGYAEMSVHSSIAKFIQKGVPRDKLVIGVPLYSRGFANTSGLGHPSSGVVSDKSFEDGVCDVKTLPRENAVEFWDDNAKATFSYDKEKKCLNSYESAQSAIEKAKYVNDNGLAGIIVWESSGDYAFDHPKSICCALTKNL